MTAFLVAIVPSLGVLALFGLAVRAVIHADRREREAQARFETRAARPESTPEPEPQEPSPPA